MSLLGDYDQAVGLILSTGGTVSVQGARGVGKTRLCRMLVEAAAERGITPAFVDAELARGIVGPPGAVSMVVVRQPEDMDRQRPDHCLFVGDVIPAGHVAGYIFGIITVVAQAKRLGAGLIVIDSCGWMDYPGVVLAKQNEIEMTAPDYVIALQRSHEAEFIITPFIKRTDIICAVKQADSASSYVPSIARANFRADMQRFLEGSQLHTIPFSQVTFTNTWLGCGRELKWQYKKSISQILSSPVYHGEQLGKAAYLLAGGTCSEQQEKEIAAMLKVSRVRLQDPGFFENLYAGLEDSECRFVSAGIIKNIDFEKRQIIIDTPALTASPVRGIRFGFLQYP